MSDEPNRAGELEDELRDPVIDKFLGIDIKPFPFVSTGAGILALEEQEPTAEPVEMIPAAKAQEVVDALDKRIADLEAMLEAERTLRAEATAEVEREKAGERTRRIEADQMVRSSRWAIEALIEALVPFARFWTDEGQVRGMTEPVCLSMSSVKQADALIKLYRALR